MNISKQERDPQTGADTYRIKVDQLDHASLLNALQFKIRDTVASQIAADFLAEHRETILASLTPEAIAAQVVGLAVHQAIQSIKETA